MNQVSRDPSSPLSVDLSKVSSPAKEAPVKRDSSRFLSVDIVKAFCIIAVILTHVGKIPNSIKLQCLWPFTILPAVPTFLMCSIFVFCLAEDKKQGTILSWFSTKQFLARAGRIFFPFMITILITLLGLRFFKGTKNFSAETIFNIIQRGGRGPGSYYVMVIFQLLVLFPFLRHAYNRNQMATVLGLVLLQIAYETLCKAYQLDTTLYAILIFRFFTHLALGFLLYSYHDKLKGTVLPAICIVIGVIYLINVSYLDYEQVLVYAHSTRSMIAVLYSFGVLCYVLRLENPLQRMNRTGCGRLILRSLLYIGKASYHIMLTQMVYFYFMRLMDWEARLGGWKTVLIVDLAVCLSAGCLFFALENLARKWISKAYQSITTKKR